MSRFRRNVDSTSLIERTRPAKSPTLFESFTDNSFNIEELAPYLCRIPDKEVDMITMYYVKGKKQKEIAEFFDISQGAVSHRLSRAKKRLKFLKDMPKIEVSILQDFLSRIFDDLTVRILISMTQTTCQSLTAIILNDELKLTGVDRLTQVKVRHKFLRAKKVLSAKAEEDVSFKSVSDFITYISKGNYMLHEVKLPHFNRGSNVTYQGTY